MSDPKPTKALPYIEAIQTYSDENVARIQAEAKNFAPPHEPSVKALHDIIEDNYDARRYAELDRDQALKLIERAASFVPDGYQAAKADLPEQIQLMSEGLSTFQQASKNRDETLATLRRLHAAAKIVTAYEWPQDVSPMGAMDEFDAAMTEAENILNTNEKGDSTEQQ